MCNLERSIVELPSYAYHGIKNNHFFVLQLDCTHLAEPVAAHALDLPTPGSMIPKSKHCDRSGSPCLKSRGAITFRLI
jgi:hypothetical protein